MFTELFVPEGKTYKDLTGFKGFLANPITATVILVVIGCGMDKDGVGLGLYLVKTIINSHDEDIAVTSRDGVTEFVFTLALSVPEKSDSKKEKQVKE